MTVELTSVAAGAGASGATVPMAMPAPRGPLSAAAIDALRAWPDAGATRRLRDVAAGVIERTADALRDEDVQLTLFLLYELHYGGIAGVPDDAEWDTGLLDVRALLETAFEEALRRTVPQPHAIRGVSEALFELVERDDGPSVASYIEARATREQAEEMLVNRSIYTLKEADPHSWAIPRLHGAAKVALVEIQADEYGGGRPERMHAGIFARTMRLFGLDDRYGAYVDNVHGLVFASANLMSLFGLHRRFRGAIVGHLAAYEMTSSIPNRAYGNGFRRLGFGADVTDYFDEHVEADAVHEQIAARDLAGGLVRDEPALVDDVLFGASACLVVDGLVARTVVESWEAGESSLRMPVPRA